MIQYCNENVPTIYTSSDIFSCCYCIYYHLLYLNLFFFFAVRLSNLLKLVDICFNDGTIVTVTRGSRRSVASISRPACFSHETRKSFSRTYLFINALPPVALKSDLDIHRGCSIRRDRSFHIIMLQ